MSSFADTAQDAETATVDTEGTALDYDHDADELAPSRAQRASTAAVGESTEG